MVMKNATEHLQQEHRLSERMLEGLDALVEEAQARRRDLDQPPVREARSSRTVPSGPA
jgi:hypothetical protein